MILQSDTRHRDATIRVEYGTGDWPDHHKVPLYREALGPVAAPGLLSGGADWRDLPRRLAGLDAPDR